MTLLQQSVPGDLPVSLRSETDSVLHSAVRKAALRFVPLLTIAYLFNYLDRTSLGFAALTMNQQLGLSASQFGLAAGMTDFLRGLGGRLLVDVEQHRVRALAGITERDRAPDAGAGAGDDRDMVLEKGHGRFLMLFVFVFWYPKDGMHHSVIRRSIRTFATN